MSLLSSRPLPHLPLETQAHVLRFCDQATLAVTSRVSLAFLELSIPNLHGHIHIDGLDKMEKLLCSRAGSPLSALDGVLSLRHVRAFTLVCTDQSGPLVAVSFDRLASGWSLSVGHLTLELFRHVDEDDERSDPYDDSPDPRWDSLLPVFDPVTVLMFASPWEPGVTHPHAWIDLASAPWHRLRTLHFTGAASSHVLGDLDLVHHLASEETVVPLTVIYTIAEEEYLAEYDSMLYPLVSDLAEDRRRENRDLLDSTSRVAEIIVRAPSQAAKEEIMKDLETRLEDLDEEELERERKLIRFEVTGPAGPTNAATA